MTDELLPTPPQIQEAFDRFLKAEVDSYKSLIEEALKRDFAAEEDIATIRELDGLHAYERGVLDVQEFLAKRMEEIR